MLKIRLRRMGAKKAPFYRIVVADSRAPRDGAFVEEIGYYNPLTDPAEIKVDNEKAQQWIKNGAQPTDTVRVYVKVIEGTRERLQNFEGIVIKIQGGGIRKTFTVRRMSYGVGVERTFPYNSPRIGRIEVVRHGEVRRAKLYYLRNRVGKAAKVVERIVEK